MREKRVTTERGAVFYSIDRNHNEQAEWLIFCMD